MKCETLSDGRRVWCLRNQLANSNTFFVETHDRTHGIVVDPGSETPALIEFLRDSDVVSLEVYLTHGHFDHVIGVSALSQAFGSNVFMNSSDEVHLRRNNFYLKALGSELTVDDFSYTPISDGGSSTQEVSVFKAPGHTAGGMIFGVNEGIFVGDLLMPELVFSQTVPGFDRRQWAETVRKLWPEIAQSSLVFFGHGRCCPPGILLESNAELRTVLSGRDQSARRGHDGH